MSQGYQPKRAELPPVRTAAVGVRIPPPFPSLRPKISSTVSVDWLNPQPVVPMSFTSARTKPSAKKIAAAETSFADPYAKAIYGLAVGSALTAFAGLLPLAMNFEGDRRPIWAEIILCVATLQAAYAAWVCTIRDWSVVRTLLVVHAVVATMYAMVFMLVIATPGEQAVMFDLSNVRGAALGWCPLMAIISAGMAFVCGRVAHRWRFTVG